MALWQYSFQLLEKQENKISNLDSFIEDISLIFGNINEKDDFHIIIGEYETNICEILLRKNKISEIYCRLDLRGLNKNKLEKFFKLIDKYNLNILIIEEKIIGKEELLEKIKNSDNLKFLKEGKEFFKDI